MSAQHQNLHGPCDGCDAKLDRYPGFDPTLRMWFDYVRRNHFDFHVSDAGRGKVDQEADFHRGASRAHFGQSPHSYNAAIDTFFLDPSVPGHYSLSRDKYLVLFERCPLGPMFEWYGAAGAKFPEIPHIQLADWRELAQRGDIRLVEPL